VFHVGWEGQATGADRALFAEANKNGQPSDGIMLVYFLSNWTAKSLPSIRAPFRQPEPDKQGANIAARDYFG
jgi:hypothetical protein